MHPNENTDDKTYSVTHFIIRTLVPFYWQLLAFTLIACYWALHISLQPIAFKLILDSVSTNFKIINLTYPVAFYFTISAMLIFSTRLYGYIYSNFYPKLKTQIIALATETISKHSYFFFQNQMAGSLANRIKDLSQGTAEILQIFVDSIFSNILALIIASVTLAGISPIFSIILMSWAIIFVFINYNASKSVQLLSHEFSTSNSRVVGNIVDRFTNNLIIRLFATRQYEKDQLNHELILTMHREKKMRLRLLKISISQDLFTFAMMLSCLLVLIYLKYLHQITIGEFALVFTLVISFSDIIRRFTQELSKFTEKYGLVSQGIELLNSEHEITDTPGAFNLQVIKGKICFQNVYFQYEKAKPLFIDKSVIIPAGQKVALVGPSGSGKTTFVNLILRLYDINSGHIFIDDQDISKITHHSLCRSIAMIPQDPILFHRSFMENIRYSRLDANDHDVFLAAKKAQIHDFIMSLPNQYATIVGERGTNLSGGQRQRIAIARAILKNAPIIIFDEATSALDSITEALIKDCFAELMYNKTSIVIAHRLSTLLNMDRILVFNDGRIAEDGSHHELLSTGIFYKKMWETQVGDFFTNTIQSPLTYT